MLCPVHIDKSRTGVRFRVGYGGDDGGTVWAPRPWDDSARR